MKMQSAGNYSDCRMKTDQSHWCGRQEVRTVSEELVCGTSHRASIHTVHQQKSYNFNQTTLKQMD